jgi:LmbE family N-acetylglucosaminyl deacetylase
MENRQTKKTLLAVLAHPDDESFGMGGTLALYASRGVDVHLVCATRGEAGEVDPEYLRGYASVAELREHELRCAVGTLGLAGVHFLDYRDSGMAGSEHNDDPRALINAPMDEVVAKIVGHIRRLRPQVVITFDPIGGYRHPDHITIHQATRQAFLAAGDPAAFPGEHDTYQPEKLYYYTISRRFLRLAVRLLPLLGKDPKRWGRNGDIDLASLAVEDFPVHARISYRPVKDAKQAASACHASQGGLTSSMGIMRWLLRLSGHQEEYMRAHPQAGSKVRERDLFEGIDNKGWRNGR